MSDSNVTDFLREQFPRLHVKLDLIQGDITNLKVRMSALEAESGHIRIGLAELNSRLDRIDARVDRIERRPDLVETH